MLDVESLGCDNYKLTPMKSAQGHPFFPLQASRGDRFQFELHHASQGK